MLVGKAIHELIVEEPESDIPEIKAGCLIQRQLFFLFPDEP